MLDRVDTHSLPEAATYTVVPKEAWRSSYKVRKTAVKQEFTEREQQVAVLVAQGLSNKLIADKLCVSPHTAKFHLDNLMKKLGGNRALVAATAVRKGWV